MLEQVLEINEQQKEILFRKLWNYYHCDLNDKNTLDHIKNIIEDTECCLCFDVIQPLTLEDKPIYLKFSSAKL